MLFAFRRHEQVGDLLVLGAFGPAVAAIVLSHLGKSIPGSTIRPRLICFGLTWLVCWMVLLEHARLWDELHLSFSAKLLLLLPSIIPAWIVSTAFSRDDGVRANMQSILMFKPIVWHSVALLLFPGLLRLTAIVMRMQGGSLHQPKVVGSCSLVGVEFGYAFFFGGGVSEEPGWRGFLLPRLQQRFSPLVASILVWFPWGLWHAPLDLMGYAGSTFATYLHTRVFILIPLSIIITWIYNGSGKTILSAVLFHSAFNVAPDFMPSTELAAWMISLIALVAIVADRMWEKNV